MSNHAFAGSTRRDYPLVQAMLRFGVASTAGLLLVLCLVLAVRRFGGAFDQPLNPPTMLMLGFGIAALACCLRTFWPRAATTHPAFSIWARRTLPSVAVFLFCYSLSLPGSSPWAVALLWFVVVSEEGAWWLADSLAYRAGRESSPRANRSPRVPDPDDHAPRPETTSDVDADTDVTQQMTRIRDADGSDLVFGQARAEFALGERSRGVHLAFCPPLPGSPQITVAPASGPPAAVTVVQAEPFGARFDVRLAATARQSERVTIEFESALRDPKQAAGSNALIRCEPSLTWKT